MKVITYSLFGYDRERQSNCFDFNSYLRGMMICIRMNRLLYPDWITRIETDHNTYNAFLKLFIHLDLSDKFQVRHHDPELLTKAMLWRLKPVFEMNPDQSKVFTHVLCRDLDSPATYREVQAVQYWMNREKASHAITDSVSHTVPMLGGMIGFIPDWFTMRVGVSAWSDLFSGCSIDFNRKGADQDYLNSIIYPKFAQQGNDSITQHYFNGMPNTFLSDYRTCTCPPTSGHKSGCENDMDTGLTADLKESNAIAGHIGASGAYQTALTNFLMKYKDKFEDLREIEKEHSDIFYWIKDGTY